MKFDCFKEMIEYCRNLIHKDVAVIILEGILALHFSELRELMDIKIFVHADAGITLLLAHKY